MNRSPSTHRSEVDGFWDGAGRYAVSLGIGAVPVALVRVWGHFTIEAFLEHLISTLLALALLFPVFWGIKNVFGSQRPKSDV